MSEEATFNLLARLLNYIFAISMLILGMIGSMLIILVVTQKRAFRRNTSLTYLLAGAIITGIHLPTIYIQMILVFGFGVSLMNTNESACREHTYLRYVTTVAAISFPC
jgi:ABC-type dipeptide/oligopeptide/nickel transport system permease component